MSRNNFLKHIAAAVALAVCAAAHAQLPMLGGRSKPTVIQNVRILNPDGTTSENLNIVIVDGVIRQVAAELNTPGDPKLIDAAGQVVTPGFIDVCGSLGMTADGTGPSPVNRAWDAFDRYDWDAFSEAFRNGVTMLYIPAPGGSGITGLAAVVRLEPGEGPTADTRGKPVVEDAALCVNLASETSPLSRLNTFDGVRRAFRAALERREALDTYEQDLEEYVKKVEERAKKAKEEEAKKEAEKKPAANGPPAGGEPKPDAPEKKEEELKKPTDPGRDPASEVLLRALDRELPVRITAHRSADILNALELKEEFSLDLILDGASEAYLVADQIARAKVPVALGSMLGTTLHTEQGWLRNLSKNAAALDNAGVKWAVGSGARSPDAGRFVLMNAQLAAAGAARPTDALDLVTTAAADFLGLTETYGKLERGMKADLVLWSGDPRDPASRVEAVYINGDLRYRAPKNTDANTGDEQ